ncbi:MAG: M48 family metallopeptidase, partial [Burkholderiaceae bacterium]
MASLLTSALVVFLLVTIGLRYWLASRQIRYVTLHAEQVPAQFADRVSLEAHRKAAHYTVEKTRLGIVETAVGAGVLVGLTLLGGLQSISDTLRAWMGSDLPYQVAVVAAVVLLLAVVDLPFSWIRQFRIEQRFGFNRMTPRLWVIDLAKSLAVASLLGLPLLAATVWLMQRAGDAWWLYVWLLWIAFNALVLLLYPTVIAPIFNKFEPLKDSALVERIGTLLIRTGFASKGVFVMDGSRRSAHGNAYFTGLGRGKRIVFFDTLIERLLPPEIEAVLAHELGHFKLKHIAKRLAFSFFVSLGVLALLGWLITQPWFFAGLGVEPSPDAAQHGVALVLFMLVLPVFTFVFAPLASVMSRKHEFEADRFAARNA